VQGLEPWLVNRLLIRGDVQPSSVVMTGLPATEDTMFAPDLEAIRAPPLSGSVELFIGVISSSNNYARRMAVRRTWLQYPSVRNRTVAVRFFVGLVSWEFLSFGRAFFFFTYVLILSLFPKRFIATFVVDI